MPMNLHGQALKDDIVRFCKEHDADLVGFAPAERWDEYDEVPPDFRLKAIFPQTRTVIVIGMSMPLPVVEATPSAQAYSSSAPDHNLNFIGFRFWHGLDLE